MLHACPSYPRSSSQRHSVVCPCCRWLPGVSGACEATIRALLANANCDPVGDRAHEQVVLKLGRAQSRAAGSAPDPGVQQQQLLPPQGTFGGGGAAFDPGPGYGGFQAQGDPGGFMQPPPHQQQQTVGGGAALGPAQPQPPLQQREVPLPKFEAADPGGGGERPHLVEQVRLSDFASEMTPVRINQRYEFMRESARVRALLRARGSEAEVRGVRTVLKEVLAHLSDEITSTAASMRSDFEARRAQAEEEQEPFDEAPPTGVDALARVVSMVMATPCELALMSGGGSMRYYDYAYHCAHARGETSGGLRPKLHRLKLPQRLDMQDTHSNFQLQLASVVNNASTQGDRSVLLGCFERVSKDVLHWQQSLYGLEMCTPEMMRDVFWLMTNKDHDRAVRWRLPLHTPESMRFGAAPSPATCRHDDVFHQVVPADGGGLRWSVEWPPLHEVTPISIWLSVPAGAPGQPPESRRLPDLPFGPRNGLQGDGEAAEVNHERAQANRELLTPDVARAVAKVWMTLGYVGKTEEAGADASPAVRARLEREAVDEGAEFARLSNLRYVPETVSVSVAHSVSTAPFTFEDGVFTINQAWFLEMANLLQRATLRMALQPGMVSKIEFKPYFLNIARRSEPAAFRLLPAFGHATEGARSGRVNVHRPTWTWWSTRSRGRAASRPGRRTARRTGRRRRRTSTWRRGTPAPTGACSTF